MATRYYFPSTGAAAVSPPYWVAWDKDSEADRLKMVTTKISSAFSTKACSENSADFDYDVLNRMYVSDPIGVHDFTGCTYKIQVRCVEDDAKANFVLMIIALRVTSNDGQTLRFALEAIDSGATEFDDDVLVNRAMGDSCGAGISQNGDRIVFELGIRAVNTKTTLFTATMDFGDNSGTDLPENETETTQYNPWIEFSHNIAAYVPPSGFIPRIIGPF